MEKVVVRVEVKFGLNGLSFEGGEMWRPPWFGFEARGTGIFGEVLGMKDVRNELLQHRVNKCW